VALDLIIGQLGKLTGLAIDSDGLFSALAELAMKLGGAHLPTLALGLGLLCVLRVLRRWTPRIPGPLVAVGLGLVLSLALDFRGLGIHLVGAIPQALPAFALPIPRIGVEILRSRRWASSPGFRGGIVTARSSA
jgi:MFS superfamily sulfate permease-like transporter